MFTGIIKEIGYLKKRTSTADKYQLEISAEKVLGRVERGDSIAVNGVCLTVVQYTDSDFVVDVMPGTLEATNLSGLKPGAALNLEPAVTADSFLGGHIVTGHVDGTGKIVSIVPQKNARLVQIEFDENLNSYMVDKGSVALNGISLTIYELRDNNLTVSLIPETWNQTTFKNVRVGDKINIETDIIGKYILKLLKKGDYQKEESTLNMNFLKENGFA